MGFNPSINVFEFLVEIKRMIMKKNILKYSLLLILVLSNTAFAEDSNKITSAKKQIDLTEINLNTNQTYYMPNKNIIAEESSEVKNNTLIQENFSGNKRPTQACICSKKSFFSFLNPIGDALKLDRIISGKVKKVNNAIDKKIDKADKTPFKGIKKIDDVLDKGVEEVDSAVGTTLEGLNEITVEGADAAKKLFKTGIQKETISQWMDGDFATGRFFGARPIFESHGVTINSSYLYSPFMKTGGGASGENGYKGYGIFNLGVTLDTEKAGLWKGGTFFTLYQKKVGYGLSGANPDGAMGDFMGFDGWDWRQINQISEYWYQQKFFDGKVRVKLGKQDSNTDFAYLNSGWDFMNSGFSVTPTIPLVTYPDQSFGFMAEINPKEWLSIRDGIYSRFNVPFNITEIEFKPKIRNLPGRYMLGAWELSDSNGMGVATGEDSNGTIYNNFYRNFGGYINFEQMVYKEKKDDNNDLQGLVVFGQFGISPSNKNDMSRFMSLGLHYQGLFPKRDNDIAGIAVGSGYFASRLGDITYDNGGRVGSETVVETFYRFKVNNWFYLQPDLQFIMSPGGIYANSVAVGIRSVITF